MVLSLKILDSFNASTLYVMTFLRSVSPMAADKKKRGKTEVMQKKTKSLVFFIPCRFHTLFFVFFFKH